MTQLLYAQPALVLLYNQRLSGVYIKCALKRCTHTFPAGHGELWAYYDIDGDWNCGAFCSSLCMLEMIPTECFHRA